MANENAEDKAAIEAEIEALHNSPRVTRHPSGSLIVKLEYPFEYEGKLVSEIAFSGRTKGKHLRAAGNAKNADTKIQILLAQLSGLDEDAIEEMDADDINLCAVVVVGKRKPSATGKS